MLGRTLVGGLCGLVSRRTYRCPYEGLVGAVLSEGERAATAQ